MEIIGTEPTTNSIVRQAFLRMGNHAYQLACLGAPLRLLAGLLCTSNYGSVYKIMIDENEEMKRDSQRGVSKSEKEFLANWKLSYPLLAAAMSEKGITQRRWCCAYDLVNDANFADITLLTNSYRFEVNYGKPDDYVNTLLREDFPEAFGLKLPPYISARVDSNLYFNYNKVFSHGETKHLFSVESLKIKVIHRSAFLAYSTYTKRLRQEIRIARMALLLKYGLSENNIKAALAWLPEDVSKSRTVWGTPNPGLGHIAIRNAEIRYQKEYEERQAKKNQNR